MDVATSSTRMVAWLNSWMDSGASTDAAIEGITGPDTLGPVVYSHGGFDLPEGSSLALLFGAFRRAGVSSFRLALPAPGDISMLPAAGEGTAAALGAGEAVVAEDGSGTARALLVPGDLGRHGILQTRWDLWPTAPVRYSPLGAVTLSEAERSLKETVAVALGSLQDSPALDAYEFSAWREQNLAAARNLRGPAPRAGIPELEPRAAKLADMAYRMIDLTRLALPALRRAGDGAPHVVELERAARAALMIAVNHRPVHS